MEALWNFYTEVRHCIDRVVNCIYIARFEVLGAVLMEDVRLCGCLLVGLFINGHRHFGGACCSEMLLFTDFHGDAPQKIYRLHMTLQ
jgi:hypothetical protein